MNKWLLLAGSVRVLTRYKLRTFFMSLGIVVGVAVLVIMRSMGSGAETDMLGKVNRMFGASSIIITNSGGAMHGGSRRPGQLTIEDVEALGNELEHVVDWDSTAAATGLEVRYGDENRNLMVVGHSEQAAVVWQRGVASGEFLSESDVRSAARVALIGSKTAEALFGGEDPLGRQIQIAGAPFRVKGVLEAYGIDPHGMDRDDEIHVPITTMLRRIAKRETIGTAKLIVSKPDDVDATVDLVTEILRARHGLADNENDDFSIFTPTGIQSSVREANQVVTLYLPATAGVALLVAAIVIANIMLIGVRERIPEIGLRKAVGATSRQIGAQFLLESLAVSALSGGCGVAIGVGLLLAASRAHAGVQVTPDSIVLGLIAALVVGVLAGYLPARQAAQLEPVEALR